MSGPRAPIAFLTGIVAGALLLAPASAAGFGFITKWTNRDGYEKNVKPNDVATDGSGHVYVVGDYGRVQKFTGRGTLIAQWESADKAALPSGVATDGAGNVYVAEIYGTGGHGVLARHRVEKFTAGGRLISRWPIRAPAGSEAAGIATDRAGYVYVTVKKWIEKFTSKGRFVTRWTDSGPGALAFDATVAGVATDAVGNVYVTGGARVTKFTSDGGFVLAWGKDVGGPGVDVCTISCRPAAEVGKGGTSAEAVGFSLPGGIAIDGAEHVYVADWFLHRVQEFSTGGAYLGQFGGYGSGNGQFRSPVGLATDARDDLYVVDHNNFRIQKFGEPSSAFGFAKRVKADPANGTARLVVDLPGVGRLDLAGAQVESASRTAKGAGKTALEVVPTDETRERLDATGRAAVQVAVTYTPTTPGIPTSATRSKRVELIQLPNLTTATFDGASLRLRLRCPASFEPLCVGRALAVTARDRCGRSEGRRVCRRGAAMTTSVSVRLKPTESSVVKLKVKSGFRHRMAQLARHPGARSLLIRQSIHANGFKRGRPQVVFHTYGVRAG